MEEYILLALLNLAVYDSTIRCAAGQCKFALNLDTHLSKELELDAAAMLGHRLYAISAIASDKSDGESKKHMFEAYVRARQLGGDEARTALVCCVDNPRLLLDEVTRAWDAEDKLQVFGRGDLLDLEHKLQLWFKRSTM